jgi:hypothetical protein
MFLTFIKTIWGGLFCEVSADGTKKFSLGRLILLSLYVSAMISWSSGLEIPETMLTILLTMTGYTFGTKALASIEKLIKKK